MAWAGLASAATHAVDLDGSLAGRLAAWRFNRADFATDTGVVPTTTNHVAIVSGADGAAVAFRATKGPSFLRYPLTGTNGGTLLNLTNGGFRLLYRPDWCSRTTETFQGMTWGVGPERWVRLLEVADASTNAPPLLALSIDPSGTNLVLQSRDPQGRIRTNFVSPLRWLFRKKEVDPKGGPQWHEVLVSYTPTNSIVVINGMARDDLLSRKPQGPGIASPAPAGAASLLIGGSQNGSASAEGALDELETFGRPLTPLDSYARRDQFTLLARVSASPPQVDLRWHGIWFEPVEIRRRRLGDTQWQTLAKDFLGLSFSDRSPELEVGFLYEYAVGRRTTVVALNARPQGARGCVLLLVDRTVARPLERELAQFRADLVGDGWQVARQTVPRHDDEAWRTQRINPRYIADVNEVKSRILAACSAASNELKAVVLIGHVTIPFSGVQREDGHIERNGAWPADSFYGDIDGRWSDAAMDTGTNVMDRVLANVPGDGKLDPWLFNDHIDTPSGRHGVEVAVGRIDFARLPAYQPASETDLLRRYFDKNHRYRHKELAFDRRSIAGDYFLTPFDDYGVVTQHDSFSAASRLAGLEGLEFGNLFADGNSYLFGVLGGFGAPDAILTTLPGQGRPRVSTAELAKGRFPSRVAFYVLFGSYFGNWYLRGDDLLRACLAQPNTGLASCYSLGGGWKFEELAVGGDLGAGYVRSAQGGVSTRTTFLLGDPTLRAFVTAPPTQARARRRGAGVQLAWTPSAEATDGYFVFRSQAGPEGAFAPVNTAPVTVARFTDSTAPRGRSSIRFAPRSSSSPLPARSRT